MVGGSRATAAADGAMGTNIVKGRARRAMTVTVLGGALSLAASAAACSGGGSEEADDEPRTTTTTERTTTTLDPEEAARQEVIAAREAADEAEIEALAPPAANPDFPALEENFTGLMLERLVETAAGLQRSGVAQRYPSDSVRELEVDDVRFQTVDGQQVAFLKVCVVDDGERVVVSSGEVLDSGVRTYSAEEAMQKVDGRWKLAERRQDDPVEGVAGCATD